MKTESKLRGGTDSARRKGLKNIQVWLTPEQHRAVFVAAAQAGIPAREFATAAVIAAAENKLKKARTDS